MVDHIIFCGLFLIMYIYSWQTRIQHICYIYIYLSSFMKLVASPKAKQMQFPCFKLLLTLRIIERCDRKDPTGYQAIVRISDLFHLVGGVWARSTKHGQIGLEGGLVEKIGWVQKSSHEGLKRHILEGFHVQLNQQIVKTRLRILA